MTGGPPPKRELQSRDDRSAMTRANRANLEAVGGRGMAEAASLAAGLMHASSVERETIIGEITNRNNEKVREACAHIRLELQRLRDALPDSIAVQDAFWNVGGSIENIERYGIMDVPIPEPYSMGDALRDAGITDS